MVGKNQTFSKKDHLLNHFRTTLYGQPSGIFQKFPCTLTWHGMSLQNRHSFSSDDASSSLHCTSPRPPHSPQSLSQPQASVEGNWPEDPSSLNSQMPYFIFLIYLSISQGARGHHFTLWFTSLTSITFHICSSLKTGTACAAGIQERPRPAVSEQPW